MSITYKQGDLLTHNFLSDCHYIIPHIVNNSYVMGSGVAKALYTKWPAVKEMYLEHRLQLGSSQIVQVEPRIKVINMMAQVGTIYDKGNVKPIRYEALVECMKPIQTLCVALEAEIIAPKFGSDRARGNWDFIAELIEEMWVSEEIPVTIYTL